VFYYKLTQPNLTESSERVTKIENIKTDATKILRPTHFSGSKNIKTDSFSVGLNLSKKTENKTKNTNKYKD
jgi:hypothetical protein